MNSQKPAIGEEQKHERAFSTLLLSKRGTPERPGVRVNESYLDVAFFAAKTAAARLSVAAASCFRHDILIPPGVKVEVPGVRLRLGLQAS